MKAAATEYVVVVHHESRGGVGRLVAHISTVDANDDSPRGVGSDDPRNVVVCSAYVGGSYCGDRPECEVWGWDVKAEDIGYAGASQLEATAKVLRQIDRKLEAMADSEGRAETFGQYVNRFARAVGAKRVCQRKARAAFGESVFGGWLPVAQCAYVVDSLRRDAFPTTAERAELASKA